MPITPSPTPSARTVSDDPLLVAYRAKVDQSVPPNLKASYLSIVKAGKSVLFGDSTHDFIRQALAQIQQRGNKPDDIANGMTHLMAMVYKASGQRLDPKAVAFAMNTLTAYVLDYMKATMGLPITKDFIMAVMQAVATKFDQASQAKPAAPSPPPAPAAPGAGLLTAQPQGGA